MALAVTTSTEKVESSDLPYGGKTKLNVMSYFLGILVVQVMDRETQFSPAVHGFLKRELYPQLGRGKRN